MGKKGRKRNAEPRSVLKPAGSRDTVASPTTGALPALSLFSFSCADPRCLLLAPASHSPERPKKKSKSALRDASARQLPDVAAAEAEYDEVDKSSAEAEVEAEAEAEAEADVVLDAYVGRACVAVAIHRFRFRAHLVQ